MNLSQIGIQLYTLREHAKTEKDLAETLSKVAAIGYKNVQISGVSEDIGPEFIRDECEKNGLIISATHEASDQILTEPQKVIQQLKALGTSITAYPFPRNIDFSSEESVSGLIEGLNKSGEILAGEGLTLCYHNHHHEFRKLNGKIILERIYEETNPAFLKAELDSYWVQVGGGDTIAWLKKLGHRSPILHLKDYMITDSNEVAFTSIGSGNLDFPAIIKTAEDLGCQWFVVEQDKTPLGAFQEIETSFKYLYDLADKN